VTTTNTDTGLGSTQFYCDRLFVVIFQAGLNCVPQDTFFVHSVDAAECLSLLSWLMLSLFESHSVDTSESAMHRNESPTLTFVLVPTVLVDV
jgi:hypothetical protein